MASYAVRTIQRLVTIVLLSPIAQASASPNIVVIMADDLGWKDVGYNGSEIETPNLDQLAAEGVRLDRFYATPACSSTRASLMTGQSNIRVGVSGAILQTSENGLPLDLKLLPQYLQDAGYQTALIGKWHLGHAHKAMLPMQRGFDYAYGFLTGGLGYYTRVSAGRLDWHRNEVTLREEGYATKLIGDDAVRQIKQRDTSKPLYLHIAFSAPHLPNEAPETTIAKYADIDYEQRRIHAAMVDEMDEAIGDILQALDTEGITDNTLVWFFSDNGGTHRKYNRSGLGDLARFIEENFETPAPTRLLEFIRTNTLDGGSDNGPLRGGKGSVFEGGVLVPSIVSWPGHFPSRPITQRITVQDILPTLVSIASKGSHFDQIIDGADQSPLLRQVAEPLVKDYVVGSRSGTAYYMNEWKLIQQSNDSFMLFNLDSDPYETRNLIGEQPKIAATMTEKLSNFPRGELINDSLIWFFLDPEEHGGVEEDLPWADIVQSN